MDDDGNLHRFERIVLPHLPAGYNLARWLTRSEPDADDLLQEAYLRAFRAFARYRGGDARAWLLTIVRNTCYSWLRRARSQELLAPGDDAGAGDVPGDASAEPETLSIRRAETRMVRAALEQLPAEFREALVLREIEGFSYKEIADIADIPLGTVMSRLARARRQLQHLLLQRMNEGTGS